MAVTVVQASQSSSETKDRNGFNRRVIRPRGLNATTAESEAAIVLTAPVVQDCDSGNGEPVAQDCSCSTKQLAAQAIGDAITMVQAVQEVWNDLENQPILELYMGAACLTSEASTWINGEFSQAGGRMWALIANSNLGKPSQSTRIPMATLSRWSAWRMAPLVGHTLRTVKRYVSLHSELLLPKLNPTCSGQGNSSFIGFCNKTLAQQDFISRAAMLEQLKAGQVSLLGERLGANYGRAALSLLVQLVPLINSQRASMEIFRAIPYLRLTADILNLQASSSAIKMFYSWLRISAATQIWVTTKA